MLIVCHVIITTFNLQEDLVTMISKIETAFKERLNAAGWLDDTTKLACDAKVRLTITSIITFILPYM